MKRILLGMVLVLVAGDLYAQEPRAPSIHRGIWGRVVLSEGDCMPGPDQSNCRREGSSRRVYVLEPVKSQDMDIARLKIPGVVVADTISDADGFYEVEVPPGVYSVFVDERGEKYCNFFNGPPDRVCQVEVKDTPALFNIDVDDAIW
jgi:hypothetical protein